MFIICETIGKNIKLFLLCNWIKWHWLRIFQKLMYKVVTIIREGWLANFVLWCIKRIDPDWCGSVVWAPAWESKGRQFNSQSGHMPGLQARSLFGSMQEATNWCFSNTPMSLSSFSLPSPLSKNIWIKYFFKKKRTETSL